MTLSDLLKLPQTSQNSEVLPYYFDLETLISFVSVKQHQWTREEEATCMVMIFLTFLTV
jgi:hypothetical protein